MICGQCYGLEMRFVVWTVESGVFGSVGFQGLVLLALGNIRLSSVLAYSIII